MIKFYNKFDHFFVVKFNDLLSCLLG